MNIYLFFLFFIVFYSFIGYNPTKPINKNIYWLVAIMLILFAALRGNGYDWDSYYEIYRGVHAGDKREGAQFVEYGFQLLCYVCPHYRILIATAAILSVGLALSAIYNLSSYSRLPLLGLVIFYTTYLFGGHMGQIRQALAGGFVLWAIVNSLNQQKIRAIVLIIIAAFFHVSALLALAVPFLPRRKYPLILYILIIAIAFAISDRFVLPYMANYITNGSSGVTDKLMVYAASESAFGFTSTILIRVIILLLALLFNRADNPNISFLCNIYLYGIFIYGMFNFLPQLAGRGSSYFSVLETILVPYIVCRLWKKQAVYLIGYLLVIALSGYRFFQFFSDAHNYSSYIPYLG